MTWLDELLTWNSSDYGGITKLTLQPGTCWTPQLIHTYSDFCKGNQAEGISESANITLTNDGTVSMYYSALLEAKCAIDMKLFPFDEHICWNQFYSTKYTADELKIHFNERSIHDKQNYRENPEWGLHSEGQFVYDFNDNLSSLPMSYAATHMTLKRRPSFIIINSFAPAWLVSILILLTPLVPPDSERLSLAITTYLAMVFMNVYFVSEIPRNSIEIPLISTIILAFSAISTFGIIWSIFIVCLSKMSTKKSQVPDLIRKLLCISIKENKQRDKNISVKNVEEMEKSADERITKYTGNDVVNDTGWYDVSRFLDKIYFVTSVLTVGVTSFTIYRNTNTE
jgi:hypothetical protein